MIDKPGYVVRVTDCDFAGVHPSETGIVVFGFTTGGAHDFHLELTPRALASLEVKLAGVREAQHRTKPRP